MTPRRLLGPCARVGILSQTGPAWKTRRRGLQGGEAMPGICLEQRLVLQAIGHPGRGGQTLGLDGLTVDGAQPEGAGLDPSQCVLYLAQHCRVALGFVEIRARVLLGDTRVPEVPDTLVSLLAAEIRFTRHSRHEVPLEIEESLFVLNLAHERPLLRIRARPGAVT